MKVNIDTITDKTALKKAIVYCVGVKKRCRSVDKHRFDLGFYNTETTCDSLSELACQTARENMKSLKNNSIEINLQNCTIELSRGMRIQSFSSDDIFNRERLVINDISL